MHASIPEGKKFERQRERSRLGWEFEEEARRARAEQEACQESALERGEICNDDGTEPNISLGASSQSVS